MYLYVSSDLGFQWWMTYENCAFRYHCVFTICITFWTVLVFTPKYRFFCADVVNIFLVMHNKIVACLRLSISEMKKLFCVKCLPRCMGRDVGKLFRLRRLTEPYSKWHKVIQLIHACAAELLMSSSMTMTMSVDVFIENRNYNFACKDCHPSSKWIHTFSQLVQSFVCPASMHSFRHSFIHTFIHCMLISRCRCQKFPLISKYCSK